MSRYTRKAAILAKKEATIGVEPTFSNSTDGVLFSNVTVNVYNANNVPRDLVRATFGASEQLVGTGYVEVSFDVEYAPSGTAGTAPAWGTLLQACGATENVQASYVEYTPLDAGPTVSLRIHMDGALHKILGARGDWELKPGIGERPVFSFRFLGVDGGITATSNPSLTLTAWKTPQVVTDPNSGDILLGATYSAGALSGGSAYKSKGFSSIKCGNDVQFTPLLGGDVVDITARESAGAVTLFLVAADTVSFMADIKANTLTSMGWVHGTGAGKQILFHAPQVQRLNYKYADYNGRVMSDMDLRFIPTTAGQDEWRIVCL